MIAMVHKSVSNFAGEIKTRLLTCESGADAIERIAQVFDSLAVHGSRLAGIATRLKRRMDQVQLPALFWKRRLLVPNSISAIRTTHDPTNSMRDCFFGVLTVINLVHV